MTSQETLAFIPQPESVRSAITLDMQAIHEHGIVHPQYAELGHIMTPTELDAILPGDYTNRRYLRMGAVRNYDIAQERLLLQQLLKAEGLRTFTIAPQYSEWMLRVQEDMITMEGNGQTENYPPLTDQKLWFRFENIHGEQTSLEGYTYNTPRRVKNRLVHPDLVIPHTFTVTTDQGEEPLTLLTNNTDSGFMIIHDRDGEPHLLVNRMIQQIGEITGRAKEINSFLETVNQHVQDVHFIDPLNPAYTPLSGLEIPSAIIMQNISESTQDELAALTGKKIIIAPTLVAHQEAGYGGPRCAVGTTDPERAALMYKLAQRGLPTDYTRGKRNMHNSMIKDVTRLLALGDE